MAVDQELDRPPCPDTRQRRRARSVVRFVVAPVILALALTVLVMAGRGAWQATRAGVAELSAPDRQAEAKLGVFQRAQRQLAAEVPEGCRIVVDPAADVTWRQRIPEFATIAGCHVVLRESEADFRVGIGSGAAAGPLVVTPVR